MHPAVSLTIILFMTLMIGMPLVGWLVSGRHSDDRGARYWFLAIALDSLQLPLIAAKSAWPSWWTCALPGAIPVMFFATLMLLLRREAGFPAARPARTVIAVGALYLLGSSLIYLRVDNCDFALQLINNLIFLGCSLALAVQAHRLARMTASRGMHFVSLGFAFSLLGYGCRAYWHFSTGTVAPTFEFSPVANFQIWTVAINLVMMTFGYLGYTLEKAQLERLRYATAAAESAARERVAAEYNAQLLEAIHERDQMVMINSRFLNLNALAIFNSAIVHEISQPLQAVLMCLEVVRSKDREQGGALRADLDEAVSLTDKAGQIVSVLRQMMQQGKDLTEPVCITDELNKIMPIIASDSRRRGVQFEQTFADQRLVCRCNAVLFQRLILNLVANAFDAFEHAGTPKPSLRLEVAVEPHLGGRCALISLTDNGPGLPPEQQQSLFKPFATNKPEGLGVGLSLAQILLRKWGGKIEALDGAAGGLRMMIRMPLLADPH